LRAAEPEGCVRDMGEDAMLNNIGPAGLLLIAIVVLVLFGRGKIASLMGEVGKGITSFKRGIKEGSEEIEDASRTAAGAGEHARDITPEKDKG
jgi:sec-independent protein translocase protein TatA